MTNASSHNTVHQGFILTRQGYDQSRGQGAECVLWLQTEHGPARLVLSEQRPLFFIQSTDQERTGQVLQSHRLPHELRLLPLKTFSQEQVCACYFSTVHDFYLAQEQLRREGIRLFETDIRLVDRLLMERFITAGVQFIGQPRQRNGFVEYHHVRIKPGNYQPELSLLSLDIECSERGELYSIGLSAPGYEKVLMIGASESDCSCLDYLVSVADERQLLQYLEAEIQQQDPDVIIGWNVINFDFRLILQRAERLRLVLRLGRGGQTARWRDSEHSSQGFITLAGRVVIDGIDALKSATWQFPSFSLENVSQTLLGKGKKAENVHDRLGEIKHNFVYDKPKLAAYNLEDCRLVEEIFQRTDILRYLQKRAQLTGLALDRVGGSVAAFTNLYLPHLHRAGYIAPNLPMGDIEASPGGFVMSSRPGLYKNVLVLDFKSLYPSIIRTFKVDPLGLIEGLLKPDSAIPGFRGGMFDREKHFLPAIIDHLWQSRDLAKRDKNAAESQAIKIIMNSFYGVLGSSGCRFYDPRLASSITLRGHAIMKQTARWIESAGYQVIYGDTDSTFVWLDGDFSQEQARAIGRELQAQINQQWTTLVEEEFQLTSYLELEFETHFNDFLMPTIRGAEVGSKKRYAGLIKTDEGEKLIFKGLETVRSDWTSLAGWFQTELYGRVFRRQPVEAFIREVVQATLNGDYDEQLVYRKRLRQKLSEYTRNVPPQVRAARLADENNAALGRPLQYQNKGWIEYVITRLGPEPKEYQNNDLDYQHYIDKQLAPVADAILPFIGLSFGEVVNPQIGLF